MARSLMKACRPSPARSASLPSSGLPGALVALAKPASAWRRASRNSNAHLKVTSALVVGRIVVWVSRIARLSRKLSAGAPVIHHREASEFRAAGRRISVMCDVALASLINRHLSWRRLLIVKRM